MAANPRNAASGTLKLLNPSEVSRRGLDAYFYYVLSNELPFDDHVSAGAVSAGHGTDEPSVFIYERNGCAVVFHFAYGRKSPTPNSMQ